MNICYACVFLCFSIASAQATEFYISSSQGNDSNSGISSDAPWKSLINVYVKNSATNHFVPGDSILLKAGDNFNGPLTLTSVSAGTEHLPITVGRYGTGENPIIYGDNLNIPWSAVPGHPGVYSAIPARANNIQSVYDMNGNKYTRLGQGTDTLDMWLDKFTANNWGFTFNTSDRIYIRTPDGNLPQQMRVFQYSAVNIEGNYNIVEHLDIRRSHMGMVVNSARGFIFRNNTIEDTQSIGIYGGVQCSYGEIANNTITRTGWTALYSSTGQNNWIHHNTISHAQENILGITINGKELCGIGLERGVNNLVEHNSITYVKDSFFDYWLEVGTTVRYNYGFHSGGAAYPGGTGLKLHNNIFNVDGGKGIGGAHDHDPVLSPAPDAGPNLIYNNVIYSSTGYGLYSGIGVSAGIIFRNNLIVTTSTTSQFVLLSSGIDSDYNYYFCTAGAPTRGWYWNGVKYTTLGAFQIASGLEAHSTYIDPQFVSGNPVTETDFKFTSTSPCLNVGQDLKAAGLISPTQEYKDYLGVSIPQNAAPDIGAYERMSSGGDSGGGGGGDGGSSGGGGGGGGCGMGGSTGCLMLMLGILVQFLVVPRCSHLTRKQ